MNYITRLFNTFLGIFAEIVYKSNIKGRIYIVRLLSRLAVGGAVRSVYGVWLTKNWNDATFEFSVIGAYGTDVYDAIRNIKTESIFLDIGSNTGLFAFVAEKNKYITECYAIEPNPNIFKYLENNKNLNNSNIKLLNIGIGDKVGVAGFDFDARHSGKGKVNVDGRGQSNVMLQNYKVFNDIEKKYPNERFFCKIDVEGFELVVIEQLQKSRIKNRLSGVIVEIDERRLSKSDIDKIITLLLESGLNDIKKYGKGVHYDLYFTAS